MIRGSKARGLSLGFTIIEVMIVLGVSGVLLIAAITAISGQQRKTEFSQSIRDIESQVRDIINDVADGFYPATNNFICNAGSSGPSLISTPGTSSQGTHNECIFIGRAIQFAVKDTNGEGLKVYTILSSRQYNGGSGAHEVTNLTEAQPTALAPGSTSDEDFPDGSEAKTLSYDLKASSMYYTSGSTKTNIGTVAFVSTLADIQNNNLQSGSQTVNLMPIVGSSLDQTSKNSVDAINNLDSNSPVSPDGGVTICFDSGGTNQNGVLTIGSNGRQLSTKLTINSGSCS